MKLNIKNIQNEEIIHYAENEKIVSSKFNQINIQSNGIVNIIKLPIPWGIRLIGYSRIVRRVLRLDKMCVIPTQTGYVTFWRGNVYHICSNELKPTLVMKMNGCRNPMHNALANINSRELFFGEYGQPNVLGKSIYRSEDGGQSWKNVFNFSCNKIRHIHCCRWDPYEEKVWVFTGDFDGQCYVVCANSDFSQV